MWLAHVMTLARLPLAGVFGFVAQDRIWAAVVIGAAAVTDLLDGMLARRALRHGAAGWSARIGMWLDPLCDKLFAVAVLGVLAVRLDVPTAVLVLVAARDLVLVPLTAIYRLTPLRRRFPMELRATPAGKVATAAQFTAVAAIVLRMPHGFWIALATAAVGLIAVADYLVRALGRLRRSSSAL